MIKTLRVLLCISAIGALAVSPVVLHDLGHMVAEGHAQEVHTQEYDQIAHAHERPHEQTDEHPDLEILSAKVSVRQSIRIVFSPDCLNRWESTGQVRSHALPQSYRLAIFAKDPPLAYNQLSYHSAQANRAPPV
jgi:hypothetical protein